MRTIKYNADKSSMHVVFFPFFCPSVCRFKNLVVISIVKSYPMAQLIGLDAPEDFSCSCRFQYFCFSLRENYENDHMRPNDNNRKENAGMSTTGVKVVNI